MICMYVHAAMNDKNRKEICRLYCAIKKTNGELIKTIFHCSWTASGRKRGKHVLSHMERYNGTHLKTAMNNCVPAPMPAGSPGAQTQCRLSAACAMLPTGNVLPIYSDETGNNCKFNILGIVTSSFVFKIIVQQDLRPAGYVSLFINVKQMAR